MKDREVVAKMIVQSFYDVRNQLGVGFLEKVYENALAMELRGRGLFVQQQQPVKVFLRVRRSGTILPICWLKEPL